MHGLAPANASKRGNVRKGFSASRLSASSRVASLTYYPCQPRLTETLTTARDEAVCAIQQHAAALSVVLQERQLHERHSRCRVLKHTATQSACSSPSAARLEKSCGSSSWSALLPSSPRERVWLAAAGLSEGCAPVRSNGLEANSVKNRTPNRSKSSVNRPKNTFSVKKKDWIKETPSLFLLLLRMLRGALLLALLAVAGASARLDHVLQAHIVEGPKQPVPYSQVVFCLTCCACTTCPRLTLPRCRAVRKDAPGAGLEQCRSNDSGVWIPPVQPVLDQWKKIC